MTVDLHYCWSHGAIPVLSALCLLPQHGWVSGSHGTRLCSESSGGGDHDVNVVCCCWCLESNLGSVECGVVVSCLVVAVCSVDDLLFEWGVSCCVSNDVG
jgi:hypothetical protein